jgi:hypothetical protein
MIDMVGRTRGGGQDQGVSRCRRPSPRGRRRPASSGGQRDGNALCGTFDRAGANQLVALLGPDSPVAAKDPRHPNVRVIAKPAHDDGIAVGGERNGEALSGLSNRAGTDQLAALLGPDTAAAGVDPELSCNPPTMAVSHWPQR